MNNQNKTIKYFVYARKSTEQKERQTLSILTQIEKAKEIFGDLEIVETVKESKSAFKMIKRIKNGEAQGIDRLIVLLTNSHSLREIILFPIMKPKK